MAKDPLSGVVLKETFIKVRRKWIFCLILINLVYIVAIAGLSSIITHEKKIILSLPEAMQALEDYRTKDRLYGILRTKGYSLGQGIDIVEAITRKTKELDLPVALIMAVIDQESEFYPNARSNQGAQGLMQIMPVKWDEYVSKLRLEVDRRAITDPFMNITVGCHILKDLYVQNDQIKDQRARIAKTLTDYNNGLNAAKPNLNYALQVHRKQDHYEKILESPSFLAQTTIAGRVDKPQN
jgi:soluble lytic murein transglycosylase-like protein